jgi:hypothetical protein
LTLLRYVAPQQKSGYQKVRSNLTIWAASLKDKATLVGTQANRPGCAEDHAGHGAV